jgi:hypothetical protein
MEDELTPIRQFWEVVCISTIDVQVCLNALEQAEENDPKTTPTWRRLLAKSILNIINTIPYRLTVHTLVKSAAGSRAKMAKSLGDLYDDIEQGKLTGPVKGTQGLANHIAKSFGAYAKLYKSDYVLKLSDEDVALFDNVGTLDIQLRFAKKPEDLMISDDQLEVLYKAVGWIQTHWVELLQSCGQGMILDDSISYVM